MLWTYCFNVGLAVLFSWRLHAELNDVLAHSLGAQRLTTAFDLGVLAGVVERVNREAPATGASGVLGPLLYLLVYFVLVPGTLFCYQTEAPARLSILLSIGFQRFWRFARIAGLTLVAGVVVLGPLLAANAAWDRFVDAGTVGRVAIWEKVAGYLVVGLVAAVLRLYFDLVEVYTLYLGEQLRPDGRPDRRVRRVLLPALRTLGRNFWRATGMFVGLSLAGVLGIVWTSRVAMHTLAQPKVWPMFLLGQTGLIWLLFTRFWQRGAETVLCHDHPLVLERAVLRQPTF